MMPPLITVGSKPPASSKVATIEVVVVLPCVPAIATQRFSRISSASISARRTTGRRFARAAASSGLSRLIAVETTTTSRLAEIVRLVADRDGRALVAQALHVGDVGGVRALHRVAEIDQHLGDAAHADAADADEMDGADIGRQFHGVDPCDEISVTARYHIRRRATPDRRAARRHRARRRISRPAAIAASLPGSAARRAISRGEPLGREIVLLQHDRAAGLRQHIGIGELVLIERVRQRHQNRGPADHRQFRDGRGARARHDQMRRRDARRQIGEERRDLGFDAEPRIGSRDARLVLVARLLHDAQPRAQVWPTSSRSRAARYRP